MAKRQKYGAKATTVDGVRFASKKEARRYGVLKLMQRAGEISGLQLQVRYKLEIAGCPILFDSGRQATYVADFVYRTRAGDVVIEDAKGMRTALYKMKKAIMRAMGHSITET